MVENSELAPLLEVVKQHKEKYDLSLVVDDSYFEPGKMENLADYFGQMDDYSLITLRTPVKGLRYDNRSQRLEKVNQGDELILKRDCENEYNKNNFLICNQNGLDLGSLSADLCNALAPLFDSHKVVIGKVVASHVEPVSQRSRYATQGILFVELKIQVM